ncbi:testicular acid phosphatase homolog [Bacillus rossius redtenbacheri]|uniref:testicular acid phosphatase homolog n=1 Tax=Bacillus rossius redtenbacheri TaxID=93214 RepID=UPI002FDCD12A
MTDKKLVLAVLALSAATRCLALDSLACYGELQQSHVLFRTGARSPLGNYSGDPFPAEMWGGVWGALTPTGQEDMWNLGSYLRMRYDQFLSPKYDSGELLARAYEQDRDILSATYVAKGLYPANTSPGQFLHVFWQDVPVHTVAKEIDLLLPDGRSPCPAFQAELDRVNRSAEYQAFKREAAGLEKYVARLSGGKAPDYIYDIFATKLFHGLPMPVWAADIFPDRLRIYSAANLFFHVACTPALRRMYVGKLIQKMITGMEGQIKCYPDHQTKVFLYGGHGSTIVALLSAMDVWRGDMPNFSACVMVELRRNKNHHYVVTVSYKNDTTQPAQVLHLPGCSSVACPFPEFAALLASQMFDPVECAGSPPPPPPPCVHCGGSLPPPCAHCAGSLPPPQLLNPMAVHTTPIWSNA